MKTSINLSFKFLAHRVFLSIRIAKPSYKPTYNWPKNRAARPAPQPHMLPAPQETEMNSPYVNYKVAEK